MAAVVAAGALVTPADATAPPPGAPAAATRGAPDARAAHYPLRCAGAPVDVLEHATADLDGDGRPETVAEVRCHTAFGTPPSGLYVLSPGTSPGAPPRVTATLVDPARKLSVKGLKAEGRIVSATLLGYSSDAVPRCCPDLARDYTWRWHDGRFTAAGAPRAGSV
nr:hypothetical protein [Streptomyces sp. SID5468]